MLRREFLKNTGCLAIGFTLGGPHFATPAPMLQDLPSSLKRHPNIDAWLHVLSNGQVRIFTGKLELGQGIRTAIAQVAAEELDLGMNQVEIILADTLRTPNEGYTVGSGSIEQSAMAVRYASAAARQKLLELAAQKLNTESGQLTMNNGIISTPSGHRKISFAELLNGKQITDRVQASINLKPKEAYKLVGKAIPRNDINHMVRGKAVYIHDLRFPGMVYATVVRPPIYGAQLISFNEAALKKNVSGVLKTVVNGSFLGVITQDEYQALKAQHWLKQNSRWSKMPPLPAQTPLRELIKTLPSKPQRVEEKGTVSDGNFTLSAQYFKPYIMHGSMGPSCAVALYDNDVLHVWSHTQGAFPLRDALRKLLQLPVEKVQVTGVPGSGCYGHNGADDAATDAALLAMAYPGKHVRLQWTRDDEHAWEPYGSAMLMEVAAKLDGSGTITEWKYDVYTDTHSTRPGGNPENLLAAQYLSTPLKQRGGGYAGGGVRNAEPYYAFPNMKVYGHAFEGPLRVSALRSLGAYANIFAIESFMDELAEKAGKDPFEFRLAHLNDERAKDVIRKLREMIREEKATKGAGIGIAFSRYKNSAAYCAVAAKVKKHPKENTIVIEKMWAAVDAGECINLDGLKNQTEGGMIQSASWTLLEKVQFNETQITSRDWFTYPIMRFNQVPEVFCEVINRPTEAAMGAGEAAQGPAAAAIVNAAYRALGKRIRDLPIQQ
jgi:Aerobic-type carbon monoxide dehydrogenase, large subunit CoxL/CutL homologs